MPALRSALPLLVLVLTLAGCGSDEPEDASRRPGTLHGQVQDAETGQAVSRKTLLMHFYCDDLEFRDTLTPQDASTYRVALPDRMIRVRVVDDEQRYAPFEASVEIEGEEQQFDIALQPTHYVLLHARFVDGVTGRQPVDMRISGQWTGLRLNLRDANGLVHKGHLVPDDFGALSVRVPRTKLSLEATNVDTVPEQPELDLTGYEGEEVEFVIRLIERESEDR